MTNPSTPATPAIIPAPTFRTETYKGVEIRTRCVPAPRGYLWTGNYAFFTATFVRQGSERICRELTEAFPTEEAAAKACSAAGRAAVDREIRVAEAAAARTYTSLNNPGKPGKSAV
jgi:hypothetical protein